MCKKVFVLALLLSVPAFGAYVPTGGWNYIYQGDQVISGPLNNNDSLDGSWDHNNTADGWDGSGIWEGKPGGISALLDGSTTYVRIQDTGNPSKYNIAAPRNEKIYLTHIAKEVADPTGILDSGNGIFGFRARIATGDPLDDQYPDAGTGIIPWPAEGNGWVGHDRGKGNFVIGQATAYRTGKQIGFSIAYLDNDRGILTMNRLNTNVIGTGSLESDPYDPTEGKFNAMVFLNPTAWHEFLITVALDTTGVGTHKVKVVIDPDATGAGLTGEFIVTAGIDASAQSAAYPVNFIGLGMGSTVQWGAIDMDYIAYQVPEPATIALLGIGGLALLRRKS